MTTAKKPFDPFKAERNPTTGRLAGDESVNVTFYTEAVFSPYETELTGEETWQDQDFIRMTVPGDPKTVIQHQIEQRDIDRFFTEYQAFKAGASQEKKGLPLRQWLVLPRSVCVKFEAAGIDTVEELAGLSDADASTYLNGAKYRDLASAEVNKVANARIAAEAAEKEEALLARIAALEAAAKPKATAKAE